MKRFILGAIALFIFAASGTAQTAKPQNFKWLRNVTQQTVRDYHEGLSAYYENGKWGFINTAGIVVIQPQYDEVKDFSGGYSIVKQDGRWGIMDKSGKFVHQCTYDSISDIESEIALAKIGVDSYYLYLDGKKKMFELMNEIKPTYVMQLPHSRDEAALAFWKGQIIQFKEKLEQFFGVTITEDDIRKAIRNRNRERDAMKRYLELGKLDPAPMSGYEMGTRLDAGAFSFDLEGRCRIVEERIVEVMEEWETTKKGKPSTRPRLLVTGCPNAGVRDKIIKAVEEMGADVVAFDTCGGLRNMVDPVDESNPDVYEALAYKYLHINCSVMSPNDNRLEFMEKMIDEFHVDGVIEIVLQSCHTYDVEAHFVKRMVTEKKGLAYLNIETDYSQSDKGQINPRRAPCLETIDK